MKIRKSLVYRWSILFFLAAASLLTVNGLSGIQRFYMADKQLITDSSYLQGRKYWADQGNGSVTYTGVYAALQSGVGKRHTLTQSVPIRDVDYLRFAFDAQTRGFQYKDTNKVISKLVFKNVHGADIGERQLRVPIGRGQSTISLPTIAAPSGAVSVDVSFSISGTLGTLLISNPVLSEIDELALYRNIKLAVMTLWVITLTLVGVLVFRHMERKQRVSLGVMSMLVVAAMLLPDALLYSVNQFLVSLFSFGVGGGPASMLVVTNIEHFVLFFIIGVFAAVVFPNLGVAYTLVSLGTFAYFTEALQLLVIGRTSSSQDLMIDIAGAFCGVCVAKIISSLLNRSAPRTSQRLHRRRGARSSGMSTIRVKF